MSTLISQTAITGSFSSSFTADSGEQPHVRSPWTSRLSLIGLLILLGLVSAGCGKSDADAAKNGTTSDKNQLPPAAIANTAKDGTDAAGDEEGDESEDADDPKMQIATNGEESKEGTPEWILSEINKLRVQPPPNTDDVDKLKADRKQRNEKIVTMAQKAVALSHDEPDKERLFNVAVHHLMEARLQLALQGERDHIDSLYEDAAALSERDPQSQAAAEGAYAVVNLAYSHAKTYARDDLRWLQEFASQAVKYAANFPKEEPRSLPLLFTAARSCEVNGLTKEATECYDLIRRKFPKSQYAERVTGVLRRLKLAGQAPQLGGPTIDGKQISIDDLQGHAVLVVFWSTSAKPFQEQLPTLTKVYRKYSGQGLSFLGVNLDKDQNAVNQFLVRQKIAWPQIFFHEPEKQGWNNPIATFYGISEVPALWLIDRDGNVVSTAVKAADLEREVAELLSSQSSEDPGKITPTAGSK